METHLITEYVDTSLERLKSENLMFRPHSNMPVEMIDKSIEQESDWIPWKAILSQVTDSDLIELEQKIGLKYPDLYKCFLKYKHFYELDNIQEISFYKHCIRDWKEQLLDYYFESYEPSEIIEKGFIPFADYSDWGIVCFDTNHMIEGDCPIVMFDHETLYDEPVSFEILHESFEAMMKSLVKEQTNKLK